MAKIEILRGKKLVALIDKIGKTAASLQDWIQQAAVSAVVHAFEHGDVRPLNDLCDHVKFVTHNNAIMRWVDAHAESYVKYDTKEKGFVCNTKLRKASLDEEGNVLPEDLAEYEATMLAAPHYVEFAPPPAYVPVKVLNVLQGLVAKAEKLSAEDKADKRNDLNGIDEVKKLLAKLQAQKIQLAA
jgi:hypothetical protein